MLPFSLQILLGNRPGLQHRSAEATAAVHDRQWPHPCGRYFWDAVPNHQSRQQWHVRFCKFWSSGVFQTGFEALTRRCLRCASVCMSVKLEVLKYASKIGQLISKSSFRLISLFAGCLVLTRASTSLCCLRTRAAKCSNRSCSSPSRTRKDSGLSRALRWLKTLHCLTATAAVLS